MSFLTPLASMLSRTKGKPSYMSRQVHRGRCNSPTTHAPRSLLRATPSRWRNGSGGLRWGAQTPDSPDPSLQLGFPDGGKSPLHVPADYTVVAAIPQPRMHCDGQPSMQTQDWGNGSDLPRIHSKQQKASSLFRLDSTWSLALPHHVYSSQQACRCRSRHRFREVRK